MLKKKINKITAFLPLMVLPVRFFLTEKERGPGGQGVRRSASFIVGHGFDPL